MLDGRIRREPKGYQQLTVSTTAVSLTVPDGADYAQIQCATTNVRWRDDGTAPTSSLGLQLLAGAELLYDANPKKIQFIRSGAADATLDISYYS